MSLGGTDISKNDFYLFELIECIWCFSPLFYIELMYVDSLKNIQEHFTHAVFLKP